MTKFRVGEVSPSPGLMRGTKHKDKNIKKVHIIIADTRYKALQKYAKKYRGKRTDTALLVARIIKRKR